MLDPSGDFLLKDQIRLRNKIKALPVIGPLSLAVYRWLSPPSASFSGSKEYWETRYNLGGKSGDGSYGQLAEFKAEVINGFIQKNNIGLVIEYGCGDGNQLSLADYPSYIGFDVSPSAIRICNEKYQNDATKKFKLVNEYDYETAELTLSLDVLYHLIEDRVFHDYMNRLFDSSTKYVVVYSSNTDDNDSVKALHVKHRKFTRWIQGHKPDWNLDQHIPNRYPFSGDLKTGSFSHFYIYRRK